MIVLYIFLAIAVLLLMIVIHELGHYVVGKLLKFKINEFSVGFGPKIISKKKANGEVFSLRAIPLGGYCAFAGETDAAEPDVDVYGDSTKKEERDYLLFNEEKPYKRILVFLAGAGFNIISAVIFSFIFILCIGYSVPSINEVFKNEVGLAYNPLLEGDVIIAVDDKKINVLNTYEELVADVPLGGSVVLTIERNGTTVKETITKQEIEVDGEKYIGFGFYPDRQLKKVSFFGALAQSVPFTGKMSWAILGAFGKLFSGKIPISELSGPIGTVGYMAELSRSNLRNILILLPLIASNLAVFNLLPIPALDGSKVVFTVIEWIRKKPINQTVENFIHFVGIILIFSLVIILDIIGIFS